MEVEKVNSKEALEKKISQGISLIDFSAPWGAPCYLQKPIIQRLAVQFKDKIAVASMNIDENRDMVRDLGIRSIPTLIIFKNGKEIQRFVGLQSESELSRTLGQLLT